MPRSRRSATNALPVVASGLLLVALAACTPTPMATPTPTATIPAPSGDGVLRIGTLFSTSGPGSATAAGEAAGVNAAIRAIDAAGGIGGAGAVPVELISRDGGTAGDGKAEAAFAEFVERGVDVVIGPSTMDVAALLLEPAAHAGIPLLTSSARGPRPEGSDGVLFRVVGTFEDQGAALAADLLAAGAEDVALVRADDPGAQAMASALAAALAEQSGDLTEIVAGADPAADASGAAAADAVVVATAADRDADVALLTALQAAGVAADRIWLTNSALRDYDASLEGAHGMLAGVPADPTVVAAIKQEDPGASVLFGAEAYDATVLAALAAVLADDDGGRSIAAFLPSAAADGIECRSFGECLAVLGDRPDIRYLGATGDLSLTAAHDRSSPAFPRYLYDAAGKPVTALP